MNEWNMLQPHFPILACVFLRILGAFTLLPIEGVVTRLSISALFTVLLGWPGAAQSASPQIEALLAEFALGLTLGVPLALMLQAFGALGDFIDSARGQNLAELYDPLSAGSAGITALLLKKYALALLLMLGAGDVLLGQIAASLQHWPAAQINAERLGDFGMALIQMSVLSVWELCRGCFPFFAVFLIVDILAIYLAKLVPAVSMLSEMFLAKTILALWGIYLLSEKGLAAGALGMEGVLTPGVAWIGG